VLISLIYLALQVRQAQRNQQSLISQGRVDRVCDILLHHAEPGVAGAFRKGLRGEELSEIELTQFDNIFRAQMASRQDTFFQHQERLINTHAFVGLQLSTREIMRNPGLRAMWSILRDIYPATFQTFIDESIRDAPVRRQAADLDQWRAAVDQALRESV